MNNNKVIVKKLPSKLINRTIFTFVMITIFGIFIRLDTIYLIFSVYLLKSLSIVEILNILSVGLKIKKVKLKVLTWYFMIVTDLYFLRTTLITQYNQFVPDYIKNHHIFYIFTLYTAGLIVFIVNLEKKDLQNQFAFFALSQFVTYPLCLTTKFCVININNGMLWFVYPVTLVVTNDIFAFVFGKMFGRTRLIRLSPNKTWEGFIGGFIATVIVGVLFVHFRQHLSFFPDKNDESLNLKVCGSICGFEVCWPRIYLHSMCFILFASFIAPFGGFFASGLKRAFKVKDFGGSIPGHGGLTDRLDCQFLMALFTYVYHYTFINKRIVTNKMLFSTIMNKLNRQEILDLIGMLQNETLH